MAALILDTLRFTMFKVALLGVRLVAAGAKSPLPNLQSSGLKQASAAAASWLPVCPSHTRRCGLRGKYCCSDHLLPSLGCKCHKQAVHKTGCLCQNETTIIAAPTATIGTSVDFATAGAASADGARGAHEAHEGSGNGNHKEFLESRRPHHILFIVIDDMGSADLGLHSSGIATPVIDGLAAEASMFTNYYVQSTCSPTRSALLSGRYPLHTGINDWIPDNATYGLPLHDETLAQVLQRAGYRTHAVGKWHVGHARWDLTPTFRGFESFFGFYQGGESYFEHRSDGAYDFRHDRQEFCGNGCSQIVDERGNYSTHVFVREAVDIIRHHDFRSSPLFLYLAFQAVHGPDEVPEQYRVPYESNEHWNSLRKTYAGMLTAADEGIGNVTLALKAAGVWEDLVVIFTTDNGGPTETGWVQGSSNWPKRGGKSTIWEGGTTGDAFMWGPEFRTQRFEPLFHVVDWLPTLAELVGTTPKGNVLDGVSQLKALCGGRPARTEIYYGVTDSTVGVHGPAIRIGKWKLINGTGGVPGGWPRPGNTSFANNIALDDDDDDDDDKVYRLFDLETDPEERHNVAHEHKDLVDSMFARLQWYRDSAVPQQRSDETCPRCVIGSLMAGDCFVEDARVGMAWQPWCQDANISSHIGLDTSAELVI